MYIIFIIVIINILKIIWLYLMNIFGYMNVCVILLSYKKFKFFVKLNKYLKGVYCVKDS